MFLQKDEVYLNLVLEYIPETVYKVARHYSKSKQTIPISFIKVCIIVLKDININKMYSGFLFKHICTEQF